MIKRETRPAYHIAFLHIICTLALVGVTFIGIALISITDVGAKNNDWCDAMYSELMFKEVPASIHAECGNRFIYNTNKEKRFYFKANF